MMVMMVAKPEEVYPGTVAGRKDPQRAYFHFCMQGQKLHWGIQVRRKFFWGGGPFTLWQVP